MSSFRGAFGSAGKPRVHNVNSVYSGKNTAAAKAFGPSKHGLQSLGKATAVVRRMPPPATLPSLKAEHGQDPTIAIVPQGGTGWIKSSEEPSTKQNGSSSLDNASAPDLRPTWAKPASGTSQEQVQTNAPVAPVQGTAAQVVAGQVPPNNRDFPSLAASVAAVGKDSTALKPQKTSAWGTNLEDARVEIPTIPHVTQQLSTGGYIGASTAPKPNVDRKLPERYFSSSSSAVAAPKGKVNIREKLAKLSMESKESSVELEAPQEPAPLPPTPVVVQQPPPPPSVFTQPPPPVPVPQQPPPQQRISQDVRQIHGSPQHYDQPPPSAEWQQQPPPDRYYEFDRHQPPPNGRGDGGYGRQHYPGQQQHEFHRCDDPIRQQYRPDQVPMDEGGWNPNDPRGPAPPTQGMRLPQSNRYRIDSRSSNEADGNWQGFQRQRGSSSGGWYDNGGYPMNQQHSHEYQGGQGHYPSQPPSNYGRNQDYRRPPPAQGHEFEYNNYNGGQQQNNFHENDRQQQQQGQYRQPPHGPQRVQQPEVPYRMLKRNDEKSAEYIAHHGGAVVPQSPPEQAEMQPQRQPSQTKKQPKEPKHPRQQQQQNAHPENKAEEAVQEAAPKPSQPQENVWEKRMEERKREERNAKANARYQQELDYEFPSIDQTPKEPSSGEWGSDSYDNNGRERKTQKKVSQKLPKAGELDAEVIGSSHWVQKHSGPSWDNLTIPTDTRNAGGAEVEADDDVYTGTKREFVNSKRGRGLTNPRGTRGNAATRVGPVSNGRKVPAPVPLLPKSAEAKKRDDNFSNMGEFHADDYRVGDEFLSAKHPRYHRNSDSGTMDDNGFDGSRKGSKRGAKTAPRAYKKNDEDYENGEVEYNGKTSKKPVFSKPAETRNISSSKSSTKPVPKMTRPPKDEKKHVVKSTERRIEGVKSPAISEGLDEEWETASESSDIGDRVRDDKPLKPERPKPAFNNNRQSAKPKVNGTSDEEKQQTDASKSSSTRAGQKNVKPASHTFPGSNAFAKNSAAYKNSNVNNQLLSSSKRDAKGQPSFFNARENRKDQVQKDGLAGVDINDASVIVIDNQPDVTEEMYSETDFEEVMSKKQRKQKLEEEKRKEIFEKERATRQQLKKKVIHKKTTDRKAERKSHEKSPDSSEISVSVNEGGQTFEAESSPVVEPDLGTSVWNSVLVQSAATATVIAEKQMPHIPSPIARPTKPHPKAPTTAPNVSSSINVNVSAVKEEFATFGASAVATTTSNSSVTLYDIPPFNPQTSPIGTKPPAIAPKKEENVILSSDHAVLKEKLDKVKDFWQGEDAAEKVPVPNLSQAHGPNVAKVKPQPQLPDQQHAENKIKASSIENCNMYANPQAQSPNLYHPSAVYAMGQTSPFGAMPQPLSAQNPGYPVMFSSNEYMQPYSHQNSPPSHSVFGGPHVSIGMIAPQSGTRPQANYDTSVFGSMWSNGLDFLANMNPTPPLAAQQQNRYSQQYGGGSRPPSGISPSGNMPPGNMPPPMNFGQQQPRQMGNFVPTHIPPPPISQPYAMNEFGNGSAPQPIGSNRSNSNRFPMQCPPQNFRQQQQMPQGGRPQYGYPPGRPNSNPSNKNGSGFQNQQSQRSPPNNWQKGQQPQQNYSGYFNVNSKFGASQPTA